MDLMTHFLLGAIASQAFFGRRLGRMAPVIGGLGGVLADVDWLTRFFLDPITALAWRNMATHALLLIPMGGLLASLPFLWLKQFRYRKPAVAGAAVLGYGLHGVLDALTSQGTLLFWPFTQHRIALDWLPAFDPILLVILLAFMVAAIIKTHLNRPIARVGLVVMVLYICVAAAQHERAMNVQKYLADTRQHEIKRARVIPTMGNLVVWRSLYESKDRIHLDALRIIYGQDPTYRQGESGRTIDLTKLPPAYTQSKQMDALKRYTLITDRWLAFVPDRQGFVSPLLDLRHYYTPEGLLTPIGIQLDVDHPSAQPVLVHPHPPRDGLWGDLARDIFQGQSNGRSFTPMPAMPAFDEDFMMD